MSWQESQPIAAKTLHNAIVSNTIAHAYLFVGSKGTPKKEAAYDLIATLVCNNTIEHHACHKCSACLRVKANTYSDLIVLDGTKQSIKKEAILQLQEQFNKTAIEKSGKKIYLIDMAENATTEALNSLLKFLEEPSGVNTYAILMTDNIERLLPTIVSRCQVIQFRQPSINDLIELSKKEGNSPIESFLQSNLLIQNSEEFQTALLAFKKFIEMMDCNADQFNLWYTCEVLGNKEKDKEITTLFLEISILFFRTCSTEDVIDLGWFSQQVQRYRQKKVPLYKIMVILLEFNDKLSKSFQLSLLLDQCIYSIKKETATWK